MSSLYEISAINTGITAPTSFTVLKFEQQETKENSTSTINDFSLLNYRMFIVLIFKLDSVDLPVTELLIQEDDVIKQRH